MEIFHKGIAVEMEFNTINSKGFNWELNDLDEMDLYYLPLIKKPVRKVLIGLRYHILSN